MKTKPIYALLTKNKGILFLIITVVHILMLSVIVWKTYPWITGDSNRYIALSDSLMSDGRFGLETASGFEPEGMRSPGYPVFVAIGKLMAGNSTFGIILLQAVLYLASIWMVWKITCQIFNEKCAIVFLIISSVYPFIMYSVGQISAEIPTVFLLALAVFLILKPSNGRIILAAALITVAIYFRPNLILLNVVLIIAFLFDNYRDWRKPLLILLTAVVIAFPFAVRNYLVFGVPTPLPVIKGTGNSLMLTYWMTKVSLNSLVKYGTYNDITPEVINSGMLEQIAEINREIGVPEDTRFVTVEAYPTNETKMKADKLLGESAAQNISAEPIGYLKIVIKNSVRMWFSSEIPDNYSLMLKISLWVSGILTTLFGLCGAILAFTKRNKENSLIIVFSIGVFLYFIATLSWLHTEARYTITARIFVLMFAAFAVYEFYILGRKLVWRKSVD